MSSFQPANDPKTFQNEEVWVAPNATIIGDVCIKSKSSIWWGAVLRGDLDTIEIGECSNIQDNCVVHVDEGFPVIIEDFVTVGHGAVLHGCTIQRNSLIGINATILNSVVIGENCLIGSNTLVTEGKSIPPGSLVVGVPGRVVRSLSESEIRGLTQSAEHYVQLSEMQSRRVLNTGN